MSVNDSLNDPDNLSSNIWHQEVPRDDLNYISELLRSKRIQPNEILKNCGCSLFHLIIGHKNENFAFNVVRLFLKFGGDANLRSDDGLTPLHVAAIWNKQKILKVLLENKGNPLLVDIDGKSAYDYAFEENNDEILNQLEQYTLTETGKQTARVNEPADCVETEITNFYDFTHDTLSLTEDGTECNDSNSVITLDQSLNSTLDSYKTAIEEFEYKDDVYGINLIERRLLPSSRNSSISSSRCSTPFNQCMPSLGNKVTMALLSKRLEKLTFNLNLNETEYENRTPIVRKEKIYSIELERTLTDFTWIKNILLEQRVYENIVMHEFNNELSQYPQRFTRNKWKDQCQKSSFNYLLLDPRITLNLPNQCEKMTDQEVWSIFLEAIFYVGKGQRSRPYAHLYEAFIEWKKGDRRHILKSRFDNKKMERILKIWSENYGVICLHVFQNVLQNEAFTREAAIIDAIGLKHLTNLKRGQYYGTMVSWPLKQKKHWGVSLLYKALQIFLNEGEKQLRPHDVTRI